MKAMGEMMNLFSRKILLGLFAILISFGFLCEIHSQPNIIASLNFDPQKDGFSFKNYRNEGYKWDDDIAVDDLAKMFGFDAMCKKRRAGNCVEKADPRPWIKKYLEAMNIGHCEGIAVASLRMNSGLPFKNLRSFTAFQPGATSVFGLQRAQSIENYIAYYWITQTFDEISVPTKKTAALGPLALVKMLTDSMKSKSDTYLLGIYKNDRGRPFDGHTVAPIAVEDTGNQFKIHIYDNNFPKERRFIYVNKTGNEQWTYTSGTNSNAKADYIGDRNSRTMELTATSWRDNRCFDPPWDVDSNNQTGCGPGSANTNTTPMFVNASFQPFQSTGDEDGEDAEFFITGEGNLLVIDGGDLQNDPRLGYDPNNRFFDQIPSGNARFLKGGLGEDLPHYTLPYERSEKPYTIVFSGKNLTKESVFDFVFSAPGFTVGLDGIRLDPNEVLIATLSRNGETITFTASAQDTETPEIFYAFDPENDDEASYIATIGGVELSPSKTLYYDFDFEEGKLFMRDDDGNEDKYNIELKRINADGSEPVYEQEQLDIGKADNYEMDFGDWDGEGPMCFKDDDDGDGFDDEECDEEPNEDDNIDEY